MKMKKKKESFGGHKVGISCVDFFTIVLTIDRISWFGSIYVVDLGFARMELTSIKEMLKM